MTDPTLPPDPPRTTADEDELLSASLDGETTPDEETLIAADPRLKARRRELAAAAAAIGASVVPPGDAQRDRAIEAAIAAAQPIAPVIDLAQRRRARIAVVSAAAVALIVAIGVVRVFQTSDNGRATSTAESLLKSTNEARTAEGAAAAGTQSAAYVGAFATDAELTDAVRSMFSARLSSAAGGSTGAPPAADLSGTTTTAPIAYQASACSPTDPNDGPIVFMGTATLKGQPVAVFVQDDGSGTRLLTVTDTSCTVVARDVL